MELLQGAVSTLQRVLGDAQSMCSLSDVGLGNCTSLIATYCICVCDIQGLHLPLEGVMIEAQLELADTLLLVYEEHVLEERQIKSQHQQKTCIEKVQ